MARFQISLKNILNIRKIYTLFCFDFAPNYFTKGESHDFWEGVYVHEGEVPPEACPVCKVPGAKFTIMEEGAALAAEHEYGVYGKTVKNNPDISEEDKKYLYSNVGKYKFVGCQGMVNTDEIPGEQITSAHRIMPDGIKQESCLKVWDGYKKDGSSKVVGDKLSDIYILTENDSW